VVFKAIFDVFAWLELNLLSILRVINLTVDISNLVAETLEFVANDKLLKVPTDVILVCAAVLNVPVNTAALLPMVAALIVVPVSVPLSVNPVNVPKLVTLVCAAVFKFPVSTAPLLPMVAA
jgi:hypothetical protein